MISGLEPGQYVPPSALLLQTTVEK